MRKRMVLMAAAGLLWASGARAAEKADKKVNFSGNWILEKSETDRPAMRGSGMGRGGGGIGRGGRIPGGRNPGGGRQGGGRGGENPGAGVQFKDSELSIGQSEGEFKITHLAAGGDESKREFAQVFRLDGSESVNPAAPGAGEIRSRTSWSKNNLVTLGTLTMRGDSRAADNIVFKQEFSLSKDGKTLTLKTTRTMGGRVISVKETFTRKPDAAK